MIAHYTNALFLIEEPDDEYARILTDDCIREIEERVKTWNESR